MLDNTIARLRNQLDEAQEELRQLRQLYTPKFSFPIEWGLTPTEALVLRTLYAFKSGALSSEALHAAINSGERREYADERKLIHVYVCKIRKKLGPLGIKIKCHYGFGYSLTPESKHIIGNFYQAAA